MALRSSLRFSLLAAAAVNAARVDDDSLGFANNEDAKKLLSSALIESDFTALTGSMGQAALTGTAPAAPATLATAAPSASLAELSFEDSSAPEASNAAAMKSVDDEIMAKVAEKEKKAHEDPEATAQAAAPQFSPQAVVANRMMSEPQATPPNFGVQDSMQAVQSQFPSSKPDEVPAVEGAAPTIDFGAKLDSVIDGLKMPTDSLSSASLPSTPSMTATTCGDIGAFCSDWAAKGECTKNAQYMEDKCRKSCGLCGVTGCAGSSFLGAPPSLLGVDGSMQADFPDLKTVGSQASGAFASAYHQFDSAVHRAEVATGLGSSKAEAAQQAPAAPEAAAAPQAGDLAAAPIAAEAAVPQPAAQAAKPVVPEQATPKAAAAAAAPTGTQAAADNEVDAAIAKACDAEQKVLLQGATPAAAAPAAAAATSK